jgi:hypothetical protein
MVDPFGVSDTPMTVIHSILQHPKSEVYVSVMWDFIDRFHKTKEFPPHLDDLFGSKEWRAPLALSSWSDRKRGLFDLYKRQLKAGMGSDAQVVHVELYEGSRLVYAIFHATNNRLGCDRMKQAIWNVAPFDGMAFRPGEEGMQSLFADDRSQLKAQLQSRFAPGAWHEVAALEHWIKGDGTIYHCSHLRKALAELEQAGLLEARPAPGKKRHGKTFPKESSVRLTPATS